MFLGGLPLHGAARLRERGGRGEAERERGGRRLLLGELPLRGAAPFRGERRHFLGELPLRGAARLSLIEREEDDVLGGRLAARFRIF